VALSWRAWEGKPDTGRGTHHEPHAQARTREEVAVWSSTWQRAWVGAGSLVSMRASRRVLSSLAGLTGHQLNLGISMRTLWKLASGLPDICASTATVDRDTSTPAEFDTEALFHSYASDEDASWMGGAVSSLLVVKLPRNLHRIAKHPVL
jgi:hypothetical protein